MKHLILSSLLLFSVTAQLFGQELFVGQVSLQEIEMEYIEVEIMNTPGGGPGANALVDYGQECERGRRECEMLRNSENTPAVFLRRIGAINAITQAGWVLVGIGQEESNFTNVYFRKKSSATN